MTRRELLRLSLASLAPFQLPRRATQSTRNVVVTIWGAYAFRFVTTPDKMHHLDIGRIHWSGMNHEWDHPMMLRIDDQSAQTSYNPGKGRLKFDYSFPPQGGVPLSYCDLSNKRIKVVSDQQLADGLKLPKNTGPKPKKPTPQESWDDLGRLPQMQWLSKAAIDESKWKKIIRSTVSLTRGEIHVVAPVYEAQGLVWTFKSDAGETGPSATLSDRIQYVLPIKQSVTIVDETSGAEVILRPSGASDIRLTLGIPTSGGGSIPRVMDHFKMFYDLFDPPSPENKRLVPQQTKVFQATPEPYCPPMLFGDVP